MISPKEKFGSNYYSIVYSPYVTFFASSIFIYLAFSIIIGNLVIFDWNLFLRSSFVMLEFFMFFSFQKSHRTLINKQLADANELLHYLGMVSERIIVNMPEECSDDYVSGVEQGFRALLEELSKQITSTVVKQSEEIKPNENEEHFS